ncbi:DDE family transposase [Spirosoma oryzae]|uniref:DDE family transposase n=1 Tax=Spirosoma oryzae TaxID=1469603 RepID=A0A2T0RE51_9BACT|nr:transposase [Spirosoma oryzae]PRY19411.1 DDE family transposase [Spirosoma oryzae]
MTADREFVGSEFRAGSLTEWGLIPIIRIRANAWITHRGRRQRAAKLFDCPHWKRLRQARQVYGSWLYLWGKRLADGDYLILYSDRYVARMGALSAQRWDIETLFGAFKSRGFNLESCRVVAHHRLRCLLFILSIGLIWALETGHWLLGQGQRLPLRLVKASINTAGGPIYRRVYSLFRHGLDELRDRVLNHRPLIDLIPLLSCH